MSGIEIPAKAVYNEARELLLRKHADYGPANISGAPGGPLNGLRVRVWDKIARLNNLVDSGVEPRNESLRDTLLDLLNYSAIGLLVIDGDWPGVTEQAPQEAPVHNGCSYPPLRDRDDRVWRWNPRHRGYKLPHWPDEPYNTRDRTYINARYGPLTEIHE